MIARKSGFSAAEAERRHLSRYLLAHSANLIEGSVGKQTELGPRGGDYGVSDLERQWAAAKHKVRVGYGLSLLGRFSDNEYTEVILVKRKRAEPEDNQS